MIDQHGPFEDDGISVFRWGLGQWANDVLVRFSYELFEHDHRWPGQWLDDTFAAGARELRDVGHRLDVAIGEFERSVDRLDATRWASVDEAVEAVSGAASAHDLLTAYLARALDATAAVLPGAFGEDGRLLADRRRSIADLAGDPDALHGLDPALATVADQALAVRDGLGRPVTAPEFEPALATLCLGAGLTGRVMTAARESVPVARAARTQLRAAASSTYSVLDRALAICIRAVETRADDGPDLAQRWRERDWTVIRRHR